MSEINLTDDERTVLMICAKGESLAAIGRWEQPVDRLVDLGYLSRNDKFNNFITDAGRKAIGEANDQVDTKFAVAMIQSHNARVGYRRMTEEAAQILVVMSVEVASSVADGHPIILLRKCMADVSARAAEMLKEQGYRDE
jgi:hypothetical protein